MAWEFPIFTLLLMGLVATVEAAGFVDRLVAATQGLAARSPRGAELLIVAVLSAVAGRHDPQRRGDPRRGALRPGDRASGLGLTAYRRANLLDLTACTWPFLLPWCIPTILAASTTAAGRSGCRSRRSTVGLRNAYSWALVAAVGLAILTGFGRTEAPRP